MSFSLVYVEELSKEHWERLRAIRIASLTANPEAFGANSDDEIDLPQSVWLNRLEKEDYLVAVRDGVDVGIMSIEVLDGDFGATCWIGGCWVKPDSRGTGVFRAMFDYVDRHATERGWLVQGLGVWQDNLTAISAYEKLRFVAMGEPKPSSRRTGKFYQRMIRHTTIT